MDDFLLDIDRLRVAIVHDWLVIDGGAEKVLEALLELFPSADLFTLVDFLSEKERKKILGGRETTPSPIQNLPGANPGFRNYLPLFPWAIGRFDLSEYDLILSSSWAFAKGVKKRRLSQRHICYCHTPNRYAWDLFDEYTCDLPQPRKSLIRFVLKRIRRWDRETQDRVDLYLANSRLVQDRIERSYGRESIVVYPPVDIDRFRLRKEKEDFYLTVSRLVPYKKTRLIVETFNRMPERRLRVVGKGEEFEVLQRLAGPNVEIMGYRSDEELLELMGGARAFVYAALEDFGIAPVEAMACGTPVIALGRGGTAETVLDEVTGVHFLEQTVESISCAIERFEKLHFDPGRIRRHAERFSKKRFLWEMKDVIEAHLTR